MKLRPMLGRVLDSLSSKLLGVYLLISAIVYALMLTAWSWTSPNETVYRIGTNLPMKIFLILLVINSVLCLISYLPVLRTLTEPDTKKPTTAALKKRRHYFCYTSASPATIATKTLGDVYKKRGYRVTFSRDGLACRATSGLKTAWGTVLFHCSILLLAVAIFTAPFVRSEALAVVTEGQTFNSKTSLLHRVKPKKSRSRIPEFSFKVLKVKPDIWEKGLLFKSLYARIKPQSGRNRQIRCTVAWKPAWDTYVTLETIGYSPLFELRDPNNRLIESAYINLLSFPAGTQDHFQLPGTAFDIYMRILPDAKVNGRKISNFGNKLKNPGFIVEAKAGGRTIAKDFLRFGEELPLRGYRLSFTKIRYWGEFEIVHNPALWLIWAAFIAGNLAVLWRFLFYKREVAVLTETVGGQTLVHVAAKADYQPYLYAERVQSAVAGKTDWLPADRCETERAANYG